MVITRPRKRNIPRMGDGQRASRLSFRAHDPAADLIPRAPLQSSEKEDKN
jgi:hypothetical protein